MPNYIFAYHGGKKPDTQAEGEKEMALWGAWFEKLGAAVVDPGNPVGLSKTVSKSGVADNGGANPISGYTLVKAGGYDEAVGMAKDCPMVRNGSGTVEVAEVVVM